MATASLEAALSECNKCSICITQSITKVHIGLDVSRSAPCVIPSLPQQCTAITSSLDLLLPSSCGKLTMGRVK